MGESTYADGGGRVAPRAAVGPTPRWALAERLEGALGYRVSTRDGAVLGRVGWLRYAPDGHVEALMLRPPGWRALFSMNEQSVPGELVESVDRALRQIVVRAGGTLATEGTSPRARDAAPRSATPIDREPT